MMMCATQFNPNQRNHYFTASSVRARVRQIRAPEKCILGAPSRGTYSYRVTVYSYNEYIGSINPIIQYVTSLTWTINYMRAN